MLKSVKTLMFCPSQVDKYCNSEKISFWSLLLWLQDALFPAESHRVPVPLPNLSVTRSPHLCCLTHFVKRVLVCIGDCSHEIKRRLLLGGKVMTNLDSIFKSRDITLPTKDCLVEAMVFPVFMYGCESWSVKKAERRRIDAFELWCWRVPCTAS